MDFKAHIHILRKGSQQDHETQARIQQLTYFDQECEDGLQGYPHRMSFGACVCCVARVGCMRRGGLGCVGMWVGGCMRGKGVDRWVWEAMCLRGGGGCLSVEWRARVGCACPSCVWAGGTGVGAGVRASVSLSARGIQLQAARRPCDNLEGADSPQPRVTVLPDAQCSNSPISIIPAPHAPPTAGHAGSGARQPVLRQLVGVAYGRTNG